jgi:hypothetical protein
MISTKPGVLSKQGPIATLEGTVSFNTGDKLLFNGAQFVQFISQAPKVMEASATIGLVKYSDYRDENGVFRFTNGNPTKTGINTGVPPGCSYIIVGYERPVITNVIKFWSTSYIPITNIIIQSGWDNTYWTTLSKTSSFIYDDTVKRDSSESVSKGQYVYTLNLSAPTTAKYWLLNTVSYTSLSITQVQITESSQAKLRYWESDGDVSTVEEIEQESIYDIVYDKADDVYYAACFSSIGGVGSSISDTFNSESIDEEKWTVEGGGINLPAYSGIEFVNVSGTSIQGSIISNSYHTGDFSTILPTEVTVMSGTGYYGLSVVDKDTSNMCGGIFLSGDWGESVSRKVIGVTAGKFLNATNDIVSIGDLHFNPSSVVEGVYENIFTYSAGDVGWMHTRVAREGSPSYFEFTSVPLGDSPLISSSGISCSVNYESEDSLLTGHYFSFWTYKTTIAGLSYSDPQLKAVYTKTTENLSFLYSEGVDTFVLDTVVGFSGAKIKVIGATDNFVDITSDYITSIGDYSYEIPSIKIVSLDVDGDIVQKVGMSDLQGNVLSNLSVINSYGKEYGDYFGEVSIATTGLSKVAGGSIYIRVGEDIYKYNKAALPVLERERGENAVILASGVLVHDNIRNFVYDDYSYGGLSYVIEDTNRAGFFIKEMSSSTLLPVPYEAQLEMDSIDEPVSIDSDDFHTRYILKNDDIYVYNMDSSSVAFCNVIMTDPILPANSNYQTTLTAHVVNLYGDPLQGKTVTFVITSGGGTVSPTTVCTTSSGTASTVYTADAVVGTTIITATASNIAC